MKRSGAWPHSFGKTQLDKRFVLITAAALLGVLLTLALGRWQLGRAAEKEQLHQAMVSQAALAPLSWQDWLQASRAGQDLNYRRVMLRGQWLAQHTLYLDNRQMNGHPGFFVVTPLALPGKAGVVLVQRGWVPRNFQDRARVPEVQTPSGEVSLLGRVAPPPARLLELGTAAASEGSSRIRQNLDLNAFSEEIGLRLQAGSMVQIDASSDGLQRDWFEPGAGTEKHYGYAFQWFGLSALMATLYVWFQIVRRKSRSS